MSRSCPNCKARLGNYDSYFCSVCGGVLAPELFQLNTSYRRVFGADYDSVGNKKVRLLISSFGSSFTQALHILNVKDVILYLLLFFGAGVPSYIIVQGFYEKFSFSPAPIMTNIPIVTTPASANSLKADSELMSGVFDYDGFSKFIPYDSDVVIFSNDLGRVGEALTTTDTAYNDLYKSISSNFSPDFALSYHPAQKGENFAVLLKPLSSTFDKSKIDLSKYPWISADFVDGVFVITSDPQLLKNYKDAKAENEKNVLLNPTYLQRKSGLSNRGKIAIITLTQKGKDIVNQATTKSLKYNLDKMFNTFVISNKDSAVIQ